MNRVDGRTREGSRERVRGDYNEDQRSRHILTGRGEESLTKEDPMSLSAEFKAYQSLPKPSPIPASKVEGRQRSTEQLFRSIDQSTDAGSKRGVESSLASAIKVLQDKNEDLTREVHSLKSQLSAYEDWKRRQEEVDYSDGRY